MWPVPDQIRMFWAPPPLAGLAEGFLRCVRAGAGYVWRGAALLPAGTPAQMLLGETGWDQITLIAKATQRIPLTAAKTTLIERHGIRRLALG